MSWNKQSAVFNKNINGNPFITTMPKYRQDMFTKAYGESRLRPKVISKKRSNALAKGKGPKREQYSVPIYAEDLIDVRQHVMEIYEVGAQQIGCTKSQLIHAVITGRQYALAAAMQRAAERNPEGGASENVDWNAKIEQGWKAGYLLQTQIEMDLAGVRAEQAKHKIETGKGDKQVTSSPNAMKGVKVVNAKDSKVRAAKAKG